MIYCVVPEELAGELYDRLAAYYADDENVAVIVERRRGDRRARGADADGHERRLRDRRHRPAADRVPRVAE